MVGLFSRISGKVAHRSQQSLVPGLNSIRDSDEQRSSEERSKNDYFLEEGRARMSCCFHSMRGKARPWRIWNCCHSEETEVETSVKGVFPPGNGVGHSEEFAPVEHPLEPPGVDKPARCPAPEPCIVHDGRIWKERVAIARRRLDMVNDKEDASIRMRRSLSSERVA